MRRIILFLLSAVILLSAVSCSKNIENNSDSTGKANGTTAVESAENKKTTAEESGNGEPKTSDTTGDESDTNTGSTAPVPEPVKAIPQSKKAVYGKKTGTDETYTGLAPLKALTLPVRDPDNSDGLSEKAVSHSYGVSTGKKPNNISVENQKIYEKYGGMCLDTSGKKVIYLTFDCGYENGYTEKILDTLKEKSVPAAFFVTMPYMKSSPKIVARMINEGHVVGNHSDTHPNFAKISRKKMIAEIQSVDNYLRQHFGYSAPFFRFPEGAYSISALDAVQSAGFTPVFWSSAYADWDTSNQKGKKYAYDTVTSRLHPGCVLLLHAVSMDNAAALGDIIDYARGEGYEFVSL